MKIEFNSNEFSQICDESKIYLKLRNLKGIPQFIKYGTEADLKYLVFELLGPTLGDLHNVCGQRFSLQTTVLLFIQLIDRLEMLHETSKQAMLHRDIKPDNFLMGLKGNSGIVHVVDFGLAKCYVDKDQKEAHIEFSGEKPIIGTARFASVNAHRGYELSRRDDLESLGYMMIYFLTGSLPWSDIERRTIEETFYDIAKIKGEIGMKELC